MNPNLVYSAYYLNSKNDQTPIKLVAYDTYSRDAIIKAAKNKSKIFMIYFTDCFMYLGFEFNEKLDMSSFL